MEDYAMYLIVGLPVIAFIAVYLFERYYRKDGEPFFLATITGMTVALLGIIIAVGMAKLPILEKVYEKTATVTLVSLRSTDKTSGSFFLGTGSIGSNQYYFYYADAGDGGYRPGKLLADDTVTIYEENRRDGELEIYQLGFVDKAWNRWTLLVDKCFRYKIRIPKGSLKRNFNLE